MRRRDNTGAAAFYRGKKDDEVITAWLAYLSTRFPFIFRRTFWRDTFRRVQRFVQPEDFLLDIGALDAPYTRYLHNRTIVMDVVETGRFGFSPEMLRAIKSSQRNLVPIIATAEALPFTSDTFDKIICTEVMEHIVNDKNAISEMARVLKPDGQVFVTTPNGEKVPLTSGIKEHIRHYTEHDLKSLFFHHFESVLVERRFHFIRLLEMQTPPPKDNKILRLLFGLMYTFFAWFYDLIYLVERLLHVEGNYNICLVARRPRQPRELQNKVAFHKR